MKESQERENIKKYLLGDLKNEEAWQEIERRLMTDDAFAEEISICEEEMIDDYLDGRLNKHERSNFENYFLLSPEMQERLQFARTFKTHLDEQKTLVREEKQFSEKSFGSIAWRRFFSFPALRIAALALLLLGIGFGIWRIAFYQSEVDRGLVQLRTAYRGQRLIESRTTANFDYAPIENIRGSTAPSPTDQMAHRRAEILLLDATENTNDPQAHHALGLLYLADKKYDEALREFNIALNSAPDSGKIHADLGAALFEKAKQDETEGKYEDSLKNLALSLKSLNRALEIDNSSLEALFNRALVLQKMRLDDQARHAWQKYLEKDSVSDWANEARRNLELLDKRNNGSKDKSQILQDFLDSYRNRNDDKAWEIVSQTKELIGDVMIQPRLSRMFLEASRQSPTEGADQVLSAFVYLGELEKKNADDAYFLELANFYKYSGQRQRQKLLEAHYELQQGYDLILKTDFEQAIEVLETAKKLFLEAGDLWEANIAEYQIAYSLSRIDRIKESNERLLTLSNTAEQRHYKWLQVLAGGWIGETYFFLGDPSKAALYNQKSLALAEQISDNYNTHRILVQLMEENRVIGEASRAMFFTYRNLTLTDSYHTFPRQRWRDLNYAAEILQRFKYHDAALAFAEESARFAENVVKDDWMLWASRRNLALIYGRLQNFPKAYQQSEEIIQISPKFKNEAMRKRLVANSYQTLADLQAQEGKCAQAVENYNRAIQGYQGLNHVTYEYAARKGRLLCNVARGNDAGVAEELSVLLRLFDQNREKITNEADRITFFDAEQEVYDTAIGYAYSKSAETAQAFYYAENSRARSLLHLTSNSQTQPFSLTEIQQKIPLKVQILYYAVLTDKILIWRISRTETKIAQKQIPVSELEDKVQRYVELLTNKKRVGEVTRLAKELFEFLIEPFAAEIEPNQTLCLIADKILFRVPFSSLVSPKTNKYLIEDYALLFAPSATVFINETERARQKESPAEEEILSIGNPAISRKNYPALGDLPSAEFEAEEIASLYNSAYGSAKVFTGRGVLKDRIIANLNSADIVHFAGHYVPNSKSPKLSRFLLAADELKVEEIAQKELTRVRLLVLSACETGVEKFYRGEGMIGAARAFLASGVPLVVASQWSVDSDATADLMVKFHRYRKQKNMATAVALRYAQIDMITSENERFRQPYYWAAFVPVGGYTNY